VKRQLDHLVSLGTDITNAEVMVNVLSSQSVVCTSSLTVRYY